MAERHYCMRTSDRYLHHLEEWFVKQSRPLMRLASLTALNGYTVTNPILIDLPQGGVTHAALDAIVVWCEHNRDSPQHGAEWRRWELEFYRKYDAIIRDIDTGIRSLDIRAMRHSLDQYIARMAGDRIPAPVKRRLEVEALLVRMSCGRKRSKSKSRRYCSPGPSKLRNMMSVNHDKPEA